MSVEQLNANVFEVVPLPDSEIPWDPTSRRHRHYSVTRVSKAENLFEVELVTADVPIPLPPDEGASGDHDEFVDVWNDVF